VPARTGFFAARAESTMAQIDKWRRIKEDVLNTGLKVDPAEGARTALNMMVQVQSLLEQVRQKRVAAESELASVRQLRGQDMDLPYEPTSDNLNEGWVVDLKRDVQQLRMKLEEARAKYADQNPVVLGLQDQVNEAEAQLHRDVQAHEKLRAQQVQIYRAQEHQLEHTNDSLVALLRTYPATAVKVDEATAMIGINQELYKNMRDREDRAVVAAGASPDWTATLLVPASQAIRLNKHDYVRIALAPLLALAIGIGLAFFVESLDHTLKGVRDVEETLGLPVVASVPEVD